MESLYHYTGLIIVWIFIICGSLWSAFFFPVFFWFLNDKYYTWLYQTVEIIKIQILYRNKKISLDILRDVKEKLDSRKRIYRKWLLNFILKKMEEYGPGH